VGTGEALLGPGPAAREARPPITNAREVAVAVRDASAHIAEPAPPRRSPIPLHPRRSPSSSRAIASSMSPSFSLLMARSGIPRRSTQLGPDAGSLAELEVRPLLNLLPYVRFRHPAHVSDSLAPLNLAGA
jgi:hypothetical protein